MWLVAISHPRKEAYAAQQLRNQGAEVYLPFCIADRVSRGRKTSEYTPLISRYFLFSPMGLPIRTVLSTRGIQGIVTQAGGTPAQVSNAEYQDWVERSSALQDFRKKAAMYIIGQTVRFSKFGQTFTGIVKDVLEKELKVDIVENDLAATNSGAKLGSATVRVAREAIEAAE